MASFLSFFFSSLLPFLSSLSSFPFLLSFPPFFPPSFLPLSFVFLPFVTFLPLSFSSLFPSFYFSPPSFPPLSLPSFHFSFRCFFNILLLSHTYITLSSSIYPVNYKRTYRCHGYNCPPKTMRNAFELSTRIFPFDKENNGGENKCLEEDNYREEAKLS